MSSPRSPRHQVRTALALVLAWAPAVLLPLAGWAPSPSHAAAASLVVLALAAAFASTPRLVTVPPRLPLGHPAAGPAGPPVLRTRTTDPTHHPLAPRAPGPA